MNLTWKKRLIQLAAPLLPALALITPFLSWTSVACTHDGHLHYHRVTALKVAWQNGLYFPRWVPDLAFGYGFPFFFYRESIPLYLTLFPHLLGMPLPAAENLFYAACILFGGFFTYQWVRDIAGMVPATVAAVAYMAAPYILIDALIRGNSPESMALAMVPLLLWSGRRHMIGGRRRWFTIFVISFAIFSLSHNISLLIYTPVIFVYMLIVGWQEKLDWRLVGWRLIPAFGLALGMTAWYTGSALLEMDSVTLSLTTSNRNNSFAFNYTTLAEIFAPVILSDPSLQNPPLPIRLGWIPSLLAMIGAVRLLVLRRGSREQRWHGWLMVAAAAVFIFMSLPPSDWLWSNLPLIKFVQFPWRFTGRAALPLAVLAGLAFANDCRVIDDSKMLGGRWLHPDEVRPSSLPSVMVSGFAVLAVCLLVLEAVPYLYTRECREGPYPTVLDIFEYERNTGMVGVDPVGGYFPVTVAVRPTETPLEADYAAGIAPQRFDTTRLPAGAELISADYGNNRATIQLQTDEPFTGRYLSFAYPGWKVSADGQMLDITPSDPEGLITFQVPAGTQQLDIWFGWTTFRLLLAIASILCLMLLLGMWHWRLKPYNPPFINALDHAGTGRKWQQVVDAELGHYKILGWIAVAGAILLVSKFLLIDRQLTPLHRASPPQTAVLSAGEISYIGYQVDRATAESGGIFNIDIGLRSNVVPQRRYQTGVRLVGAEGQTWSVTDLERPRIYEDLPFTTYWLIDDWGWDSWEISILSGTPPGLYDIELTLFDLDTLRPETLTAPDGSVVGPTAVIGQMEVVKPTSSPEITSQFSADEVLSNQSVKLIGHNQSQAEAVPGSPILITLFWEKLTEGGQSSVQLTLQDEAGTSMQDWSIIPGREGYLIPNWTVGDVVRSQHEVWLQADLPSGDYRFVLDGIPLETVSINAPPRLTERPTIDQAVNSLWANGIELVGYNLTVEDGQHTLELVWQTADFLPESYRVFIHLLDEDGNIVAQADGVPAGWSRPTTGWRPGEFVIDRHTIGLPDGAELAQTRIGLYSADSGNRLLRENGEDSLTLR